MSGIAETIKRHISCPSSDGHYGRWGALNREQRKLITQLVEFADGAEIAADEAYAQLADYQKLGTADKFAELLKEEEEERKRNEEHFRNTFVGSGDW